MADGQLQEIKDRLDVVEVLSGYIRVLKAGRNFKALCPFHNEKTPSFVISPDWQIWHCFGCGEGGDIFSFVMKMEGMEFPEALKMLADRAGIELRRPSGFSGTQYGGIASADKTNIFAVCAAAKNFYKEQLAKTPRGLSAKKYLSDRGLSEESINIFEIGYAPDDWHAAEIFLKGKGFAARDIASAGFTIKNETNGIFHDRFRGRIMFPILDISGRTVGFGGRTFAHKDGDEAKYINTPESPVYSKSKVLYGLNFARDGIRTSDACVLVEGYMDVIGSHQMGVKNTVSSSGTALTADQIKIIRRYTANLILAFDGDLAGQEATSRSIDLAIQSGMNVRIITLPGDKDPSDYVDNPEEWKSRVKASKRIIDFYFEKSLGENDARSVEGKKAIAGELLAAIKKIPSKVEQAHWIGVLSEKIGTEEKILFEELKKIKTENKFLSREKGEAKTALTPEMSREQKWEGQLLALLMVSPEITPKTRKIRESGLVFGNQTYGKIFGILADLGKAGAGEKDLAAEVKKTLPAELFQKLSELILEIEYREDLERGTEDDAEWREEIFYSILERLVVGACEARKKGLEADIKLAEKNKDYASRDLLVSEFEKICRKTEEVKNAKSKNKA